MIDKSEFAKGPWNDEPDFDYWVHPDTGYVCTVRRVPWGSLTAYVEVPRKIDVFTDTIADNEVTYNENYYPWGAKRPGSTIVGIDFNHYNHVVPKFYKGHTYLKSLDTEQVYVTWEMAKQHIEAVATEMHKEYIND